MPVNIKISPSKSQVKVNEIFTVDVEINPASEGIVAGWQFDLSFDPVALEVQTVTEGGLLQSPTGTYFSPGLVNNTAGTVKPIYCVSTGAGSGASTSDLAVRFICQAKTGGKTSNFALTGIVIGNQQGITLPFVLQVSQVAVLSGYDLDGNGSVNLSDLLLVVSSFGTSDATCDFNVDGLVNVLDIIMVAQNFT